MSKYNISEPKEKTSPLSYGKSISRDFVEDVARKIIQHLMIERKYRDPNYSAKQLAQDLGVNMRHISAVINMRFQTNYAQMIAKLRIQEACYLLCGREFDNMTVEDIASNVGFSTRQSFYVAFFRLFGTTPKDYRVAHGFVPKADLPPAPKPAKKKRQTRKKTQK